MRNPELRPKFEIEKKTIEEKISKGEKEQLKGTKFQRETIEKLKEAVKNLGTTSAGKIKLSEYGKYYVRVKVRKKEWGYRDWDDFLAKEGLRMSKKEETIQRLKEGVKKFRTSTRKISRSEYRKYYERFSKHKTEWGYKDWKDFFTKEIAKDAWNAFLERYGDVVHIPQVSTELFVEHFLERKYPDRKAEVEKKIVELLKDWREKPPPESLKK